MKALSLWQPWASLIADGRKRIETRSWRPPEWLVGQWVAIHATKFVDRTACATFGYHPDNPVDIPRGKIVCCAFLDSWIRFNPENTEYISDEEKRYGDFEEGRFGWQFSEVRKLYSFIEVRGHQGIFEANVILPR